MNIFSFIKEHVSILDVVSEYTTLKKAGTYYKAHCPFHHEKTASFTVSPHKEIFYCFGCHVGGDVISFTAKIENCSQIDAVKLLAEQYHIELPSDLAFEPSEKYREEKTHYHNICKTVALWAHTQLLKSPSVLRYLQERGFNKQSITSFSLGYFPGGPQAIKTLFQDMKKKHILSHDLIQAHVLAKGKTTLYSPFEERIIFPIFDALGHCCGFGGRIYKSQENRPKYYNSKESEFFLKGSLLFGLDHAKKHIQETGIVFLVEGYTDCIAMVQHGYPNTVATLGTSCTLSHLKLLVRFAQRLCVIYDNDPAGKQALMRLTELCWQVNLELTVVTLPPREDPASFLAKNQSLQPLIHQAKDIFLFFIESLGNNFVTKPFNQKIQTARLFLNTIHRITDPFKQDMLLQKAAKSFDIPLEFLKKELKRIQTSEPAEKMAPKSAKSAQLPEYKQVPTLEKKIFCAIMNNVQLFNRGNEAQLIDFLPSPLKDILLLLKQAKKEHAALEFRQFFDTLNEQQKHHISKILLEEQEKIDASTFKQLLIQLHKKQWKRIVYEAKIKLTQANRTGDSQKVAIILQKFMELQRKVMPNIVATTNPLTKVMKNHVQEKKDQETNS